MFTFSPISSYLTLLDFTAFYQNSGAFLGLPGNHSGDFWGWILGLSTFVVIVAGGEVAGNR
jgi:hypothetical protein